MYSDMTKDEILVEALIQIIGNQVEIKKHLGVSTYEDCYYDREIIDALNRIKYE